MKYEIVVPFGEYDNIWDFREGFAVVNKDGKEGFVNTEGVEIVPCIYDKVWDFKEGFVSIKKEGKWGLVNTEGVLLVKTLFQCNNLAFITYRHY